MLEKKEKKSEKSSKQEAEEVKEILSVVSTEIPTLIRNIVASVFSEEAGRSRGKAAAAFYKELKEGGMPNDVASKMTEDYMNTFTSLGDLLKQAGRGKRIEVRTSEKKREKNSKSEQED